MNSTRAAYLLELARDRSAEARARLVDEAAIVYTSATNRPSDTEMALFGDIMQTLLAEAEQDVRRRLSIAVKHAAWAPRTLISSLALDVAAVAAPIIEASPVVDEAMLLSVISERGTAHRSLVAARPAISERVSAAIVETGEPSPIRILGHNTTARIDTTTLRAAIEVGRNAPDVLEAFGTRAEVPIDLIVLAYSYAGAAVRASIARRDDVDPAELDAMVASATVAAAQERADGDLDARSAAIIAQASKEAARGPTPGVLLQALMNGRKDLFIDGMAELTGLSANRVSQALHQGSNKTFIIAARAAGFDMASVAGVHERLYTSADNREWTPMDDLLVHEIFEAVTPQQAARALMTSAGNGGR